MAAAVKDEFDRRGIRVRARNMATDVKVRPECATTPDWRIGAIRGFDGSYSEPFFWPFNLLAGLSIRPHLCVELLWPERWSQLTADGYSDGELVNGFVPRFLIQVL